MCPPPDEPTPSQAPPSPPPSKHLNKLSEEQKKELIVDIASGLSTTALCEKYKLGESGVRYYRHVKKATINKAIDALCVFRAFKVERIHNDLDELRELYMEKARSLRAVHDKDTGISARADGRFFLEGIETLLNSRNAIITIQGKDGVQYPVLTPQSADSAVKALTNDAIQKVLKERERR